MSLLLMVGLAIANISVALQEPVLGITWQAAEHGLKVASVTPGGPAERAGIVPGMIVLSISASSQHQSLSSASITEEPSSLVSYAVYNRFFIEQTHLFNIISSAKVDLEVLGHGVISLNPAARSLFQLSFLFWFQIACSIIVWATSMAVINFQAKKYCRPYLYNHGTIVCGGDFFHCSLQWP